MKFLSPLIVVEIEFVVLVRMLVGTSYKLDELVTYMLAKQGIAFVLLNLAYRLFVRGFC